MQQGSSSYDRVLAYGADGSDVEGMRRGSEAAFRSLVERHQATLLRVARSWVKDTSSAEEVVHAVRAFALPRRRLPFRGRTG